MSEKKKRLVEVYVGEGDSEGGTWYVMDVYVDAKLSDEEAEEAAKNKAWEKLSSNDRYSNTAFIGIYFIWDEDMFEILGDEEE